MDHIHWVWFFCSIGGRDMGFRPAACTSLLKVFIEVSLSTAASAFGWLLKAIVIWFPNVSHPSHSDDLDLRCALCTKRTESIQLLLVPTYHQVTLSQSFT